MARVELEHTVQVYQAGVLRPAAGASVTITRRSDNAAVPHYSAETGGAGATTPIVADDLGRLNAWVDPGKYFLNITLPDGQADVQGIDLAEGGPQQQGPSGPQGPQGPPGAAGGATPLTWVDVPINAGCSTTNPPLKVAHSNGLLYVSGAFVVNGLLDQGATNSNGTFVKVSLSGFEGLVGVIPTESVASRVIPVIGYGNNSFTNKKDAHLRLFASETWLHVPGPFPGEDWYFHFAHVLRWQ